MASTTDIKEKPQIFGVDVTRVFGSLSHHQVCHKGITKINEMLIVF